MFSRIALILAAFTAAHACLAAGGTKPPGTTLVRFAKIGSDIYRGSKPETDADYEYLKSLGIRSIISLQVMSRDIDPEGLEAPKHGFDFHSVPVEGLPFPPKQAAVDAAELVLADPTLRPIYVHCKLGRDRTGMIVALHRVYYDGVDPEVAYRDEMVDYGYPERGPEYWSLFGLKKYFWSHLDASAYFTRIGH